MSTHLPSTNFLGINFVKATYSEIASELERMSRLGAFAFVATPNVDHIVTLNDDPQDDVTMRFQLAISDAAMLICDSRVLKALAFLLGIELKVITGSDLTAYLFHNGHLDGRHVALIGGDKAMVDELTESFPSVQMAQHIPPMGILNEEQAIQEIEDFIANRSFDYIFFAIGAPQSEIIAHRCLRNERTAGVALCVGASFEFLLGRKARAPRWIQNLGMEWAFRLISEPRRLWRRYLVKGPKIFRIVRNWGS